MFQGFSRCLISPPSLLRANQNPQRHQETIPTTGDSGYYAWLSCWPSARKRADWAPRDRIVDIHSRSRGTYGAPLICAELSLDGVCVGRKRVARLIRQARIQGVYRRQRVAPTRTNPRPDGRT